MRLCSFKSLACRTVCLLDEGWLFFEIRYNGGPVAVSIRHGDRSSFTFSISLGSFDPFFEFLKKSDTHCS